MRGDWWEKFGWHGRGRKRQHGCDGVPIILIIIMINFVFI